MNTRIEGTDTEMDAAVKMAGGNIGALTVCEAILQNGEEIDPDGALGGLGALLSLDLHGIYEHRIWMFYKDVCGEDLPTMLAVNRACQLGLINGSTLNTAIDEHGHGIDVSDVIRQVKDRLPAFNIKIMGE